MTYTQFLKLLWDNNTTKIKIVFGDGNVVECKFTLRDTDGDSQAYTYVTADVCFTEFEVPDEPTR